MTRPVRVLIAKIGLDGHDRGAKLIVRNLRDAGMEVIYTGLWQTPGATVHAALQEDVDVLGVSLLSAAHMTIMPELRRLCVGAGIPDLPVTVGGIIPAEDHAPLRELGIDGIFNPGTSIASIVESLRELARAYRERCAATGAAPDIRTPPGLARAITYVVQGRAAELGAVPPAGKSVTIGITGSPGVGKSTFIGRLARGLRERGRRVGVVAVDPTSPITGGSVLGDRLRIMGSEPDHDLFVRSLASEGHAGGLAPHCADVVRLLGSAGYEVNLVETVGAGQNDVEVRRLTDHVLLLLMPGAGDSIQFAKAGVFEIATGYVVNKSDLPGADHTVRQVREALDLERPIWPVSSLRNEGIDPLCDWIEGLLRQKLMNGRGAGPEGEAGRPPAPSSERGLALPRWHRAAIAALLLLSAALAFTSLLGDSATYDETSHLTAGYSYLHTGDFRLAADHPPLAKIWCAWPLLFVNNTWPPRDDPDWIDGNVYAVGRKWLFALNDGQFLLVIGRSMMVLLLLATELLVYALARRLFGPAAALLALVLAALSPTLLAHGRLVTTDVPIALATSAALLAFARVVELPNWPRLLLATAAFAAAAVTKLSWPLLIPALLAMALAGAWQARRTPNDEDPETSRRPGERAAVVIACAFVVLLGTYFGIWACYGFQSTITAPLPAEADTPEARAGLDQTVENYRLQWQLAFIDPETRQPRAGLVPWALNLAAERGLLPETYLFGLAQTLSSTSLRAAYLLGGYSVKGWWYYFPVAFAVKTPLATIGLLGAGLAALVLRRQRPRDPALHVGLITFCVVYTAYVMRGSLNIGERHLLPIYPVLLVYAGAAAAWLATRAGRWLIAGGLLWLGIANASIYPHYLAYFNELAGGPRHGHAYLADSNLDWGQDLLRLAAYAREHDIPEPRLAYFGSAVPTYYLPCTALPSSIPFEPAAELTPGVYVVSVTQLLGVYDPELRDEFWTPEVERAYATLAQIAAAPAPPDDAAATSQQAQAVQEYHDLRAKRLLVGLRHRPPDDRVGYSLFIYRLDGEELGKLTAGRSDQVIK